MRAEEKILTVRMYREKIDLRNSGDPMDMT